MRSGIEMRPHFIAIVGGSGSGKTWLAEWLLRQLEGDASRISLDDFYRDLSMLTLEQRDQVNFDHPDSIDWPLFHRCITEIGQGQTTPLPVYDFTTHSRRVEPAVHEPRRLILLDGLWLMHRPELRQLYSLSIFVECSDELRLNRRLLRDQGERGRSEQSVRMQFEQQVSPMHRCFVADQAHLVQYVVESPTPLAQLTELLVRCVQLPEQEIQS